MSATSASGRGEQGHQEGGDRAGEKGTDGGRGQGHAGPPLTRHLIAVQGGDHRGRFTRQIDQDGGGGAAVLGSVVDAGQHDQGGDRRQDKGDGQQHGDGGGRAETGQHADQGAEKDTRQAVQQVGQGSISRVGEA